jgi:uncharacterized protein YjiS (DUF1127 family)
MNPKDCTDTIEPPAPSALAILPAFVWYARNRFGRGADRIPEAGLTWFERAHQRRQLHELSDHMLRDIGLTRADVWAECSKPFWRP